jgi:alpha-1,3-glucosyltransferase
LGHPEIFLPPILVALTCAKVLLLPTYRSTDFDVHRNWLAITHNLPVSEWYFDNVNGTTVHTLDYPPAFAFFEWILSNNPVTASIFLHAGGSDRCLDLLPDSDNAPSPTCVVFQRSTVILCDVVLWMGAWMACRAFHHGRPIHHATLCFLLIVLNPGLLWLDHIHFQYNGMLLGVLLASLGCLMQGSNVHPTTNWSYDFYHLAGAALYALLLNLKHLYLPLAPVYFLYLLGKYCLVGEGKWFSFFKKFVAVAVVTAGTLLLPWVPFLLQENPKEQLLQIVARLFPFGRGLVHDYWAGNVWAFFCLANKVVRFLSARIPMLMPMPIQELPEPTPLVCTVCLFISILPGLVIISRRRSKAKLIQVVVYTSMCSFMLAYHVHEKAILTALIPLTLLVEHGGDRDHGRMHNVLFWQTSLWGLLGLFPLLFRPMELILKVTSYLTYLELASYLMTTPPVWILHQQQFSAAIVGVVIGILEFLPSHGKWEFLPLLFTSIVCAHGLIGCWALSLYLLLHTEKISMYMPSSSSRDEKGARVPVSAVSSTHHAKQS